MRVLGLDPGTATTGYGVVEGKGSRLRYVAHGTIATPAHTHFATRLNTLFDETTRLIAMHKPDAAAIEKLFFSRNVTTGITVAQARGVIALACARAGLPIGEFSPLEVKNAVVGYGKAEKRQVQEMVKILLNLDALPRPDDAADALAIAICQLHAGKIQQLTDDEG
ncbi:MAG TPA: crossover junction endodeoxyribonuclease RuvC [Candidatus Hydrogenedentes bacterium]|nr:crossover junction endodeoxyribonuclease RuvC [Candidatus Hydrogenedentota bacterium]HPG66313.1 crossover junction endodeoxyribonuclease RuvC [Candidatus Hydrogenedentota bacterium]